MAKAAKETAVAVQQDELSSKALALQQDAQARARELAELGVDSKDLVIPSIQVMQNTSGLVGDDKAKLGDIMNMATEEVLAPLGGSVKILPLKMFKTLRVYDVAGSSPKFLREEVLTEDNSKLPFEALEGSVPVKRYHTMNFFVLLKSDLDKGEGFPCLLRFKSTGLNAGKTLATHLYKAVFFRKKPYSSFVELTTKKEKKDTNTYAAPVIDLKKIEAASAAHMAEAENWLAMLAAGNYKIDDREDSHDETPPGHVAKPTVVESEVVGSPNGEY